MQGTISIADFGCTVLILKLCIAFLSGKQIKLLHSCIVLSFSCIRQTTLSFYHEHQACAIDAYTKMQPEFSERVCIDTTQSVRKERAACTGTAQIRKGLGIPNKHFATQNCLCAHKGPACYNCVGSERFTASELYRRPNLSYN